MNDKLSVDPSYEEDRRDVPVDDDCDDVDGMNRMVKCNHCHLVTPDEKKWITHIHEKHSHFTVKCSRCRKEIIFSMIIKLSLLFIVEQRSGNPLFSNIKLICF